MSSRAGGRVRARLLVSLRHEEEAAITYLKDLGSNISRFTYYIYTHGAAAPLHITDNPASAANL